MNPRAAVLACVLLAACRGSPPVRYYVLTPVKDAGNARGLYSRPSVPQEPSPEVGVSLPLRLDRVRLPPELDTSWMVRRVDPNRLQVEANRRWAAPLDEMMRRVLSEDLAGRLPAGKVVDPYLPLPRAQVRALTVDVHELYGDARCAVSLRATWTLVTPRTGGGGEDSLPVAGTEDVRVPPTGPCPEGLAAAMSLALGALSDRIAGRIPLPR